MASVLAPAITTLATAPAHPAYHPYISRSTWTFTQGFLLGQIVFVILCGVFLKYVVFEEGDKENLTHRKAGSRGEASRLLSTYMRPGLT